MTTPVRTLALAVTLAVATAPGVAAADEPPSVPALLAPAAGAQIYTTTPVFSWEPSLDPEGAAVTYDLVVRDEGGGTIASITGISGTVSSVATELRDRTTYAWTARATDAGGTRSEYAPERTFTVNAPGDVDETCPEASGLSCLPPDGCQLGAAPGAGAALLLLGLGAIGRRRRLTRCG